MKHRILAVLAAAGLLLTGCGSISAKEEVTEETMVVYQALPLPDLFVKIPEGYTETSSQFYEKYYIQDDASIIITEDNDSPNTPIKDYSTRALVQYQDMTKTLEVTGSDVVYAGHIAVQLLEFDYTLADDGPVLSTMVGYATDGQTIYILTCKCSKEHYDQRREEFLTVMQSIRIDKTAQSVAQSQPTVPAETETAEETEETT
jgi:hypothetical protein